ncbi:MAG: CPBP family intramembrane metalloprotease [Lachnospiraceae bacterium]|nr:CPBP family intramembrane metalloprotease [Lachnospiraceae bacterium]
MNSKKSNRLFLSVILTHFAVVVLLTVTSRFFTLNIIWNLICSELILLVPTLLFLIGTRGSVKETLRLRPMKLSTVFMTVLFTWLTMPLTALVNLISMLFVDNTLLAVSGNIVSVPFPVMLFLMAVYGPICEEVAFRGAVYGGYRRDGGCLGAVLLSGLLFGLIHLNFNQAAYAFVVGVLLALLVEATGSLWASILYHCLFNAQSVCLLFFMNRTAPGLLEAQAEMEMSGDVLCYSIGIYLILAAVFTTLAVMALFWMARNENRAESFRAVLVRSPEKKSLVTMPLLLGAFICLFYMVLDVVFL